MSGFCCSLLEATFCSRKIFFLGNLCMRLMAAVRSVLQRRTEGRDALQMLSRLEAASPELLLAAATREGLVSAS